MKKILAIVLMITMVAALAACGGTPSNSETKAEGTTKAAETAETETTFADYNNYADGSKTEAGEYDADLIKVAVSREVTSCGPFSRGFLDDVIVGVYEYLGVLDLDGNVKLLMLKNIEQVDDVTYDCELWDFIYDTAGNNIKASDVKFSVDSRVEAGEKIEKYDNIEVTGDYTFKIHLTEPFTIGEYEKMISDPKILSQAAFEGDPDQFSAMAIATGPYKVAEFHEGSTITFEANEDYWYNNITDEAWLKENASPYTYQNFKTIQVDTIQDATARAIALENGEIDVTPSLNVVDVKSYIDAGDFKAVEIPESSPILFQFNCSDNSICKDINIRQAICYAIDSAAIVAGLDTPSQVAYGYQPRMHDAPASWTDGREYYDHNIDKAKELLQAANYNGEAIRLYYGQDTVREAIMTMIQAQLKEVGIVLELNEYERATDPKNDLTKWDIISDKVGGGTFLPNTLAKYQGNKIEEEFGVPDEHLTELFVDLRDKHDDASIDAWDQYFSFEKCYGYGILLVNTLGACKNELEPVCVGDRHQMCIGAFSVTK